MPKYVIERNIPKIGSLTGEEYRSASQKSCAVLEALGPQIQWVESFVTDEKMYCIYIAQNEDLIREHTRLSGFPADRVSPVRAIVGPVTAEV